MCKCNLRPVDSHGVALFYCTTWFHPQLFLTSCEIRYLSQLCMVSMVQNSYTKAVEKSDMPPPNFNGQQGSSDEWVDKLHQWLGVCDPAYRKANETHDFEHLAPVAKGDHHHESCRRYSTPTDCCGIHSLTVAVNEADERGVHWIATYHWVQMWH